MNCEHCFVNATDGLFCQDCVAQAEELAAARATVLGAVEGSMIADTGATRRMEAAHDGLEAFMIALFGDKWKKGDEND